MTTLTSQIILDLGFEERSNVSRSAAKEWACKEHGLEFSLVLERTWPGAGDFVSLGFGTWEILRGK